jgi:hypothetical protein
VFTQVISTQIRARSADPPDRTSALKDHPLIWNIDVELISITWNNDVTLIPLVWNMPNSWAVQPIHYHWFYSQISNPNLVTHGPVNGDSEFTQVRSAKTRAQCRGMEACGGGCVRGCPIETGRGGGEFTENLISVPPFPQNCLCVAPFSHSV